MCQELISEPVPVSKQTVTEAYHLINFCLNFCYHYQLNFFYAFKKKQLPVKKKHKYLSFS